ncbi:uncharacterized protein I206_100472 [Kwoniella pini CBS 10737]|uniref:Uncharacterized protein n=1 Tax=Kwoniella pini CBS 10737 TaxID=1296096 RepID=A0A1B9ID59_9TREE|nr:uncharacterized protein I206_00857 [Kwoniella pini CBS 10737]OCF53552.1 hypothetical protein I206_00857 [Kwoniella pini CBS 10737]
MSSTQPFKTDSILPTSLPSATLGKKKNFRSNNIIQEELKNDNLETEELINKILEIEHEKWNEKIDKEIKSIIEGLNDLIELSNIGTSPSSLISSTLPIHLPLKTSSLINSTQNLRDLSHELKLLLLLGDEEELIKNRDLEINLIRKDILIKRKELSNEFEGLLTSNNIIQTDNSKENSKDNIQNNELINDQNSNVIPNVSDQDDNTKTKTNDSLLQDNTTPVSVDNITDPAQLPKGENEVNLNPIPSSEITTNQSQLEQSSESMEIDENEKVDQEEEDEDLFEEVS